MAIVKTYHFGATTVNILDDAYKNRTPEEIQQTLDSLARIHGDIQARLAAEGKLQFDADAS